MLNGKYSDAANDFDEAAALADSPFDRAQVVGSQGELAFKRGDMETATVRIEEAIRGLDWYVPKGAMTLAMLFVFEILVQLLHTLLPSVFHGRKNRLPDEKERLRLHLGSRYAQACWFARSKFRAFWIHCRTLNLGEQFLACPKSHKRSPTMHPP